LTRPPRPVDLPVTTVWRPQPRSDIPGSIWLPDTGYSDMPRSMEAYFQQGLQRASGGNRNKPIVFYCKASCWMSWNAAKRALSLGYTHVAWYPDGVDGWIANGLPTEARQPVPRPDVTE
jgi:PQQ-dependent catabolism-associated CXXCW motif protein